MSVKLTPEGHQQLKEELKRLEEVERPAIAERLKEAIAQGDLSENAAYDEAKDEQSRMEGRIAEIKQTLATAEIVQPTEGGKINIGSKIKIKTSDGNEREFAITGSAEADPSAGKISYDSPLGKAFVGHRKGDKVEAQTPGGKKNYTIVDVK